MPCPVSNADGRLSTFVEDLEGEVLDIGLHFSVVEFTADETLRIKATGKDSTDLERENIKRGTYMFSGHSLSDET
jgi:hypothetical protein